MLPLAARHSCHGEKFQGLANKIPSLIANMANDFCATLKPLMVGNDA